MGEVVIDVLVDAPAWYTRRVSFSRERKHLLLVLDHPCDDPLLRLLRLESSDGANPRLFLLPASPSQIPDVRTCGFSTTPSRATPSPLCSFVRAFPFVCMPRMPASMPPLLPSHSTAPPRRRAVRDFPQVSGDFPRFSQYVFPDLTLRFKTGSSG